MIDMEPGMFSALGFQLSVFSSRFSALNRLNLSRSSCVLKPNVAAENKSSLPPAMVDNNELLCIKWQRAPQVPVGFKSHHTINPS